MGRARSSPPPSAHPCCPPPPNTFRCIAAAPTSRCVFDGAVRVGKLAQRTDARQLSRNLLLARRATVNARPNLRIVADDVTCTHGCAVCDLEEEQLFYFR